MATEKLLTLAEIAKILRVSRHTVQAWISPSSPNHRAEFALLARHAGRKTVFLESDVVAWLNQRRGAVYSDSFAERSTYWRERFVAGRGLLKGFIKAPELEGHEFRATFAGGIMALDAEPLLDWLADGPNAANLMAMAGRAEGLMLATPLCFYVLRRAARFTSRFVGVKDFILGSNIFELAPLNEEVLGRTLEFPATINELSLQGYCCCIAAGAGTFLTGNRNLLKTPGLRVAGY